MFEWTDYRRWRIVVRLITITIDAKIMKRGKRTIIESSGIIAYWIDSAVKA